MDRKDIDIGTFQKFAERHQALLYPAFEMQTRFKERVLGESFWHVIVQNCLKVFDDRYIPVLDIIARYEERADLKKIKSKNNNDNANNNNNNNSSNNQNNYSDGNYNRTYSNESNNYQAV